MDGSGRGQAPPLREQETGQPLTLALSLWEREPRWMEAGGGKPRPYFTVKLTDAVSMPALFIRKSYDPGFSGAVNSKVPEAIPLM